MGIEKIAMKVRAKKSDGVHEGKLPGTKNIQESLNQFKKDVKPIEKRPLEKKGEKEAEPISGIITRLFKNKGDPSKGVPAGDKRNPLPEAEPKTPAKKIADKVKGKSAPPAPPVEKGGFAAMLAKVKGKGK